MYAMACLMVVVITIHLFQIEDRYQVSLLLLAGVLALMHSLPFRLWTAIDYCIAAIMLFDAFSCLYAKCPIPTGYPAFYSIYMLTVYIVCRKLFASKRCLSIVMRGSYLPVGIALILSFFSFFIFRNSVLHTGFEDTYHFRFLFRPLGYITNIWVEVLLLILGWICLIRRYSMLFIFLSLFGIIFSFSRGAYIALGIYLIGYFCLMPKVDKLRILLPLLSVIIMAVLYCPQEVYITLLMNKTNSQKQSTESRIYETESAWKAFKKYPLLGYGNGNYTYALDPYMGQDSTTSFSSIAPNTLVKLLVEKGIVGVLLYTLLALFVIRKLWKCRKQADSRIIACTLSAFLAKDMSQAVWLDIPFLMLIVYLLLAYLQKNEETIEKNITSSKNLLIPGLAVSTFLIWNIPDVTQIADSTSSYLRKGDYRNACAQHPEDLQLRYLYATRTLLRENPTDADKILQDLAMHYPKNSLYLSSYAERCYRKGNKETAQQMMADAITYTPRLLKGKQMQEWSQIDSSFYHNLIRNILKKRPVLEAPAADYARYGYITYWHEDTLTATTYLKKAVKKLPSLAIPWHLLGDEHKYRLLMYGAFHSNLIDTQLPKQNQINEERLFEMTIYVKIKNWYGLDIN